MIYYCIYLTLNFYVIHINNLCLMFHAAQEVIALLVEEKNLKFMNQLFCPLFLFSILELLTSEIIP